MLNLTAVFY